ncbi:EGFR-like transmembrane domain-containing protein [Aspergillus lucknowensis]|uniref:Mid2 domain-containing protein n=1 Tax=Aspergillus lucknowensis TaxID=176173 RepID=A0ABR4LUC8_9EURO
MRTPMQHLSLTLLALLASPRTVSLAQEQTPTPTPTPGSLMGWYLGASSTERLTASMPWVTVGDYAGECSTTDPDQCILPTACQNNILTWDNGGTDACGSEFSCVTFTIFETSPAGLPSASSVGCWQNWSAWTIYRERPSEMSSPTSTTATTTTTTTTTSSTTGPTRTDDPSDENDNNDSGDGSSGQGWIAGAVVGPVAGIGIVGAAAFWYMRRKKSQYAPPGPAPHDAGYYAQKPFSPQSPEPVSSAYQYPTEMPANELPVTEAPAHQTYELSTTRY